MEFLLVRVVLYALSCSSERPTEQERVALWYKNGNMWPPSWQDETDEYKQVMAAREIEIMQLSGSNERWENWMQFTQGRLVPKFTTNGFEISVWDNLLNKKTVIENSSLTIHLKPTETSYPNRYSIVFYRTKDTIIAPIVIDSVNEENMKVYPNPVSGRNITVQLTALPIGNYTLKFFNVIGQLVLEKEIVTNGNNYRVNNYPIVLPNNIKSGLFILELEKLNGEKIRKTRIMINNGTVKNKMERLTLQM